MLNTKVSIIVPIYNGEKYIKNTLDSILSQSLEKIEIVVINDGSTDNSKNILDSYAQKFDNIKVLNQKNMGVSAARNNGILASTGQYIGFVDSDDLIDKDMYKTMYEKAITHDADIAICGFIEEDLDKNILREYNYQFCDKVLKGDEIRFNFKNLLNTKLEPLGAPPIWNKIFKKSLLLENNILINENITVGEDFCLNIRCFDKAKTVVGVSNKFYHYMNINPNSIMSKIDDNKFYKFIQGREFILNKLDKYNLYSDEYFKFENGRNFANLIQIADYKLRNSNTIKEKYNNVLEVLKSDIFKTCVDLSDNKYLSKNLQLIKKLVKCKLNIIIFLILYIRSKK